MDFSYTVKKLADTHVIEVSGPDALRVISLMEKAAEDTADGSMATGREIIDFLTTFNHGGSSVGNMDKLQAEDGSWSLKLDEYYQLDSFGKISWGDEVGPFSKVFLAWKMQCADNDPRRMSARWPYTYAADIVRMAGPTDGSGVVLSRSDASQLIQKLAPALNVEPHELAEMLAAYYLDNEDAIVDTAQKRLFPGL